jgi:cellulose synthase/poly-beta-1,6-N-acetylglucosamine synthase-like glycosyltransferase
MALNKAKGDILILTDGDTFFSKDAVSELLKPFTNKKVGGVSGRPISQDGKSNKFGYWGRLLSDSADKRRKDTMKAIDDYYVSDKKFFPMSGYIMAMRNIELDIPQNVLSDDAYISYSIRNKGYEIGYTPKATCSVKYPTNLKDYYKQKIRSLGGFKQLEQFGIMQRDKQSRSFFIELGYTFYALTYPKNITEFFWSLFLFPVRLLTWIRILWERVILKKDMPKSGWDRIESTK